MDDRVRWIATQLDLTAIIWNLDTDDWAANVMAGVTPDTVNQNYQNYITMGKNGSFTNSGNIVLSHEINNMTMDFFMNHYANIKASYKNVMDVATCMNITHPYAESTVSFATFGSATGTGNSTSSGSGSTATPAGAKAGSASDAKSVLSSFNGPLFIAALFGLLVLV